jgi:hypothetical protein
MIRLRRPPLRRDHAVATTAFRIATAVVFTAFRAALAMRGVLVTSHAV